MMGAARFFRQLGILGFIIALLLLALHQRPVFKAHEWLSWLSLAFFVGLSLLMYYFGQRAARSANKHTFTNVVLGFVIGKLFLSVMIIVLYNKLMQPEDKFFLVPFFLIYFSFTIFETYFMMQLGKTDTPDAA